MINKIARSISDALADVQDGATVFLAAMAITGPKLRAAMR